MLTTVDVLAGLAVLYFLKLLFVRRTSLPRPPGPKGLPFLGNALQMPTEKEWLTFAKWGKTWGDIISVSALGQTIIILNSAESAFSMLDRKSSIYSDRPVLMMGSELVGWKKTLVLTRYGDDFRDKRKLFHHTIGTRANLERYYPMFEASTRRFVRRLLKSPEDVAVHIRHTAGEIILKIGYGYQVKEKNDPIINLVDTAVNQFTQSSQPGLWIVDILPILRHVPSWFPGASFRRTATSWAKTLNEMADVPYEFVQGQMAAGTAIPSVVSETLEKRELSKRDEFILKWAAASFYSGGADTTVSAIYSFFLAMTLYPDAQRKAQAEIDSVIGKDRLPTLADRAQLPYVDALVKEVFRSYPVVPLGVPHRVMEDDVENGYLIPQGALIMVNIWQLMRDPRIYSNPTEFNPSRFLPSEDTARSPERDPRDFLFGFGRRICPGQLLADSSVFLSCAMSLAVFDIGKVIENGVQVDPVVDYTSGTISHPKPFKCSIKARSAQAAALAQLGDDYNQE